VATRRQIGNPFINGKNDNDEVRSVAFSRDSKILAVGSDDGAARLWDIVTGKQIGDPLAGGNTPTSAVWSMAFSPDGQTLAVGSNGDTVRLWDVGYLQDIAPHLCVSVGRSLTRAEWAHYVQDVAYQIVCP
jgi:WD40 repeat protein